MRRRTMRLELSAIFLTLAASAVPAQQNARPAMGEFTIDADVGNPTRKGSARYDDRTGTYTIDGSGVNIWAKKDAFRYVARPMKGDFILTARAALLGKGVDPHRKIGWMIRSSMDSSSAHVSGVVHGDGLTSLQFRRTAGAETEQVVSPLKGVDIIQLERRGKTFIMSVAKYGDTLSAVQTTDIDLGDSVSVGLFVCAHNDSVMERATFKDVRITVPVRIGAVPYREYIGSNIELMDVNTGERRIIYRSAASVQAPNWTRDGKALIYNQDGKLYRYDLKTNTPAVINTDFATKNNNDHVLSPNGRMLGISHQPPDEGGKSVVYVVPTTGGTPKRVTPVGKSPSYLHGWSNDAKFLVYTGIRGDSIDIYKIPVTGGDEMRLTTAEGLDDGPEYGPDGRIYFNSSRTGLMQLWRMDANGGNQTRLNTSRLNDWFPHVSPNGKTIVFISFLTDVAATDHPWYKHVYLRKMPVAGGEAKVLAYVYGGQGTINVPSWSPDGRYVAFVSNTDKY
ncbi:MAG: biopolymer transporter TolR [bacterium]